MIGHQTFCITSSDAEQQVFVFFCLENCFSCFTQFFFSTLEKMVLPKMRNPTEPREKQCVFLMQERFQKADFQAVVDKFGLQNGSRSLNFFFGLVKMQDFGAVRYCSKTFLYCMERSTVGRFLDEIVD